MDKCTDEFCPDCGHHLYTYGTMFWCVECDGEVQPRDVATLPEVVNLRAKYDADARREVEE